MNVLALEVAGTFWKAVKHTKVPFSLILKQQEGTREMHVTDMVLIINWHMAW